MHKKNIFLNLPSTLLRKRKKRALPSFIQPMLATLTNNYFSDNNWLYEHKFDGERCLAFKKNGIVHLMSRNKKNMNNAYPELVTAIENQSADNFVIDGEIVAVTKAGISDFELLQGRINLRNSADIAEKQKSVRIAYCIFDLMYVDGYEISELPLSTRKELLRELLDYNKLLIYTKHTMGDGINFFKKACKLHWEGLIAKRIDSTYVGTRSTNWLKFKCIMKQELIICGYTDPKKSRAYFGALLVGYYKNKKLIFAGKVGTGFSEAVLDMLGKKLQKIEIQKCPFSTYDDSLQGIHWVKPILVAEFEFAQWTKANRLRVGRYKGLRDDKDAKNVVKETPKLIGPRNKM